MERPIAIRSLAVLLALIVTGSATLAQGPEDVRYLVVRRGGGPEKNYYEFVGRVVGVFDHFPGVPDFHSGTGVITKEPESVRYSVYRIYRTRVLHETDSEKQPASTAEGAFVLIYRRDPDRTFCASRYRFDREPSGGRKITYTDFEDGREYSFHMTKDWPRPFVIYKVDVIPSNLLDDDGWMSTRSLHR